MRLVYGVETPLVDLTPRTKAISSTTERFLCATVPDYKIKALGSVDNYVFKKEDKITIRAELDGIHYVLKGYDLRDTYVKEIIHADTVDEFVIDFTKISMLTSKIEIWVHAENISELSGRFSVFYDDNCFEKVLFTGQGASCKLMEFTKTKAGWITKITNDFSLKTQAGVRRTYSIY